MVYYLLDGEAAKTRLDALRAGSARTTHLMAVVFSSLV